MATSSENLAKLLTIIQDLESQLGDLPTALEAEREAGRRSRDEEFQTKQNEFDAMVAQKDQEKVEFGAAEYARGVVDGAASVVCPDVPPVDNSEIEAMKAEIEGLKNQVSAMQSEIDSLKNQLAEKDVQISQAQEKFSALNQKIDEAQASV